MATRNYESVLDEAAGAPEVSLTRRVYTLLLLTSAYALAYVDRSIVSILLPALKREFQVGDAALAFLSGFAFAIFFIILGIPIAGWADRGNRRGIIALSIAAWSAMTVACGAAGSFIVLCAARIGVGAGEAGLTPAGHSIISDLFPRRTRGFALAIYQSGVNLGVLIGLALGGYLAQHLGWRGAFVSVGVPGVLFAALIQFTIIEPRRGRSDSVTHTGEAPAGLLDVIKHTWRVRPVRYVFLGISLCSLVTQTQGVWLPSFLARSHHLPIGEIGLVLGLTTGVGGAAGVLLGGRLSDLLGRRDEAWRLWIVTLAMIVSPVCMLTVLTTGNVLFLFTMSAVTAAINGVHLGPTLAAVQNLTPLRMRARAISLVIFVLNFLGLGVGPLLVGLLSDGLRPIFGADSLRYALMPMVAFALLAAAAYFLGGLAYRADGEQSGRAA